MARAESALRSGTASQLSAAIVHLCRIYHKSFDVIRILVVLCGEILHSQACHGLKATVNSITGLGGMATH